MQTQSMINKGNISLGLYNLSNPMINGEYTKDMIDYISNLIQSKISPIQDLIFEETIKILEPIFNNQNKEISELKNKLNDLYISYIQQICNLNLGNEYSEQIKLLNIEIQNLNNINNNLNQNVPQMSQNQNANQVNINKLSNKYLYMISFPFACSLCKVGPIYRIMYFCKECNLVLCSRCEQFEGERHYHPLYKVQNGSQLKYLNINNITTVDRIMDNLEGAYNSVLGFFGAGQNNNNESRVQQKQQQQQAQVPQLISVVQIARNMYDLRNVTDKQIEEALIKSKGNIDQAVFSLVPQ